MNDVDKLLKDLDKSIFFNKDGSSVFSGGTDIYSSEQECKQTLKDKAEEESQTNLEKLAHREKEGLPASSSSPPSLPANSLTTIGSVKTDKAEEEGEEGQAGPTEGTHLVHGEEDNVNVGEQVVNASSSVASSQVTVEEAKGGPAASAAGDDDPLGLSDASDKIAAKLLDAKDDIVATTSTAVTAATDVAINAADAASVVIKKVGTVANNVLTEVQEESREPVTDLNLQPPGASIPPLLTHATAEKINAIVLAMRNKSTDGLPDGLSLVDKTGKPIKNAGVTQSTKGGASPESIHTESIHISGVETFEDFLNLTSSDLENNVFVVQSIHDNSDNKGGILENVDVKLSGWQLKSIQSNNY